MLVLVLTACSAAEPVGTTAERTSTTTTPATTATSTAPTTSAPASTTTSSVVHVEIPDGWTVYMGDAASIAAPTGWFDGKELLDDPTAITDGLDQLGLDALDDFFTSVGPETMAAVDIMLLDESSLADGFVTNVNIIVAPVAPITDLVTVEAAITVQIRSFGGDVVNTATEAFNGIETLIVDYTLSTTLGDLSARQYHQILGQQLYTTTFTGVESAAGLWRDMVSTMTPLG